MPSKQETLATAVRDAVAAHPRVDDVTLVGSRERKDAQPTSDWDYLVATDDPLGLVLDLPRLLEPLKPIGGLLDPCSRHLRHMAMFRGPVKVDLVIDAPHTPEPPWVVGRDTIASVDAHFWDWMWWLTSKHMRDEQGLVAEELEKLSIYVLRPLGLDQAPATIGGAVQGYEVRRMLVESALGVKVDRRLSKEVQAGLRRLGLVPRA